MPAVSHPAWVRRALLPLAFFYSQFMRIRSVLYARGTLRARRLPAKVVSVGNLTVGGTGKTPLVLWLAQRFQAAGLKVAILSRGYGRSDRAPRIFADGNLSVAEAGDEPALLSRHLPGVIFGIAADRFTIGLRLAEWHRPDVFLLDDGFQHLRLARNLDIVVLDSTDPFGGGYVLPAGRLREPATALARAGLMVLTRLRNGAELAIETVRLYHPRAAVFTARTRLVGVFDATSHRPLPTEDLMSAPVLAFCGIGNEEAFWQDVRGWGFALAGPPKWSWRAGTRAFPDHHRYTSDDFRQLVRQADRVGARALLTTEKDVVNFTVLPPSLPPCYYCRIELEFEDEEGFWQTVLSRLQVAVGATPIPATRHVN